jgi:tRNA U34 2-thiouridine synthase MnmA/TrmU
MELTVKLTTEQVIEFIQQIPPEEKIAVLTTLAEQAHADHAEQMRYGEAKVRKICAARGLDWDAMTEEKRIDFIDDLVHEDRECDQ